MNTQGILIGAYIDNQDKKQVLYNCLKKIKRITINSNIDYKVVLVSHSPVDIDIQEMVDYFICDNNNEMITIPMNWWAKHHDFGFEYNITDYRRLNPSYAVFTMMKQGMNYLNNLNISKCHWLNYDIYIENENLFIENSQKLETDSDAVFYRYDNDASVFKYGALNSTLFSVKTGWFLDKIKDINNSEDYLNRGDYDNDYDTRLIIESFLYKLFKDANSIIPKKEWDSKYSHIGYGNIESNNRKLWLLTDSESFYIYCDNNSSMPINETFIVNGIHKHKFTFMPGRWMMNNLGDVTYVKSIQSYDGNKKYIDEVFDEENLNYHLNNHKLIWLDGKKF